MELEIRDTQSSDVVTIPAAGMTFGREGSSADRTVPDRTVSSKHAKIFERDAKWYIEDLRSSNGTFVNGERISTPIQLTVGDRFSLCRYGFEVVRVVGGERGAPAPAGGMDSSMAVLGDAMLVDNSGATDVAALSDPSFPTQERPRSAMGYSPEGELESLPREPTAPAEVRRTVEGGSPFAYFIATVPKAAGYYMTAVPQLLFAPLGFVRKGIANQRFGAFGPRELIAYALPAFIVGAALGIVATTIYQLIWGKIGIGLFISPLITLGISAVVAIITGFIWHPLLRWFVTLLKGESTEESRSNYFVMAFTGVILTYIPAAVGTFMGLIPEPLLGALPMVLGLAANLIVTFIAYSWFKFFRVVKWFPILLVVLGGLSCVMTAKGLVDLVRARISGAGVATAGGVAAGGSAAGTVAGGDPIAIQNRIAELERELHAGGLSGEEVQAKATELQELRNAALTASTAAASAAASAAAGATAAGVEAAAAGTEAAGGEAAGAEAAGAEAAGAEAAGAEAGVEAAGATAAGAEAAGTEAGAAAAASSSATPYEEFLRKRAAVEDALNKDPTLLKKKGVESLYKELHKIAYKVKQKHKVKMGKKVTAEKIAQQKVAEKLRDAEIYEQSAGVVDRLYKKIVEKR